jgi:hypothetical protein
MKAAILAIALLLSDARAATEPGSGPVLPPNTYSDSSVQMFSFGSKEHPIDAAPGPIQDPSAAYSGPPIQGRLSPEAQRNVGVQIGFSDFGVSGLGIFGDKNAPDLSSSQKGRAGVR